MRFNDFATLMELSMTINSTVCWLYYSD